MVWLAAVLCEVGLQTFACKPQEIIFTEDGLFVDNGTDRVAIDVLYRFYELFDLLNIPKAELMLYSAKKTHRRYDTAPEILLGREVMPCAFSIILHFSRFGNVNSAKEVIHSYKKQFQRHGLSMPVRCPHMP